MEESVFHVEIVDTSLDSGQFVTIEVFKERDVQSKRLIRLSFESDSDGTGWVELAPPNARAVGEFLIEASKFVESKA